MLLIYKSIHMWVNGLVNKMNGVKEKEENKVLTYEELARLLRSESLSDSAKPISIKSTQLYTRVKELTEMAYPTQVNPRDKRWNYFYVPLIYHGENAVIPMSIMEYNSSYYIYFPSSESLKPLRVTEGNNRHRAVYDKVIASAAEFLPSLVDTKSLENMVPYEFRTGKIKGKYIFGKERLIKEEAEKILNEYEEHIRHIDKLPMAGASISLNDYLRVVYIAYVAVFEKVKEMSPIKAYEYLADFRHGGMLEIKDPDSTEQFNKWLSNNPLGSHPFEIVAGFRLSGISLVPPIPESEHSSGEKYFVISVGDSTYYEIYLAMLKALMHEKVPVIAPQLKEVLEYLTGESYFLVNRYSSECISYRDVRPEYRAYIEWDPLEVVKPKEAFDKRE